MLFGLLPEWIFGMCLSLLGTITSNLGLNVQKLSHKTKQRRSDGYNRINGSSSPLSISDEKPYYTDSTWLLGFGIFILGEMTSGVAMGYASQSLLAVLSSCSLIANGIFASWLLDEKVNSRYINSSAIIMLGSSIVVCSASHKDQHYRLSDLAALFKTWPFFIFLIVVLMLLALVVCLRQVLFHNPRVSAALAAICACFSVLFAKCSVQLLKASFFGKDHENQLIYPASWLILCAFLMFAAFNVHFLNQALKQGSSVTVFPFYFACSTILIVTCGVIFFREFAMFSFWQFVCFVVGVSVTIYGVQHLSKPKRRRRRPEIDQDNDVETFPVTVEP